MVDRRQALLALRGEVATANKQTRGSFSGRVVGRRGAVDRLLPLQVSLYQLPEGLPVPEDDGAADHLLGQMLPQLTLESSQGPVSMRALSMNRLVLYIYPRTGHPERPPVPGWDDIPGARGCTPQSCAFRDHTAELEELGAAVAGLSAPVARRAGRVRRAKPHPLSR